MHKEYITTSTRQTQQLAQEFAEHVKGAQVICLAGDLGAGKTTFTQGLLKALGVQGPYTSPTFAIMKHYQTACSTKHAPNNCTGAMLHDIYHIDAYRIGAQDLMELGFGDFAQRPDALTIIEWPENVQKIMPTNAVWINFLWLDEKQRKITFSTF